MDGFIQPAGGAIEVASGALLQLSKRFGSIAPPTEPVKANRGAVLIHLEYCPRRVPSAVLRRPVKMAIPALNQTVGISAFVPSIERVECGKHNLRRGHEENVQNNLAALRETIV